MRVGTVSVTQLTGTTIDVPVHADTSFTGKNVKAYIMQFSYNSSYLTPVGVVTAGTISAQMVPTVNTGVAGQITMAGAGTAPLTTSGIFIYLRFTVAAYGNTSISFTGSSNNYFNEGTPTLTAVSGSVNITQPPVPTISPASAILIIGETQQFTASSGVSPYTYSVTNGSVAAINTSSGLLTANAYGITKVNALGSNGATGTTSGDVDIRICRLSIPTNYSLYPNQTVDVAVSTTNVTGRGLNSGEIKLTFNGNILETDTILLTGGLLVGSTLTYNKTISGTLNIAFARTTVLSGSGTLLTIRFKAKSSGGTGINFTSAFFNQSLNAATTNGNVNVQQLPTLTVSPNTATLFAGATQQFTVSGSVTQPVSWASSDTNVAKINSTTGLLTAKRSGVIKVNVTDAIGATDQSDNITIYDTRVIIPDTQAVVLNAFNLPVFITSFPASQGIQSMQGAIDFRIPELSYMQIVTQGTLTQGWTFTESLQGNRITFAGAGTTPFTSSGILFYLRFNLTADMTVGENAYVNFNNFLLNEGVPLPILDNGSIIGVVCSNANCNDNSPCTTDACVGGSCVNTNTCGTTISGSIVSEQGAAVRTVQVALTGTSSQTLTTGIDGMFSFNVNTGGNYTITPAKNNDVKKTNGVSTLDITLIRRHLLGSTLLSSPYKIIAADVNSSNSVTTLDIAVLRKLILGIDTTFNGKLWQFVPHDNVFANPLDPFPFDKQRSYTNLSTNQTNQNFIGVKLGDVNGNWNPNILKVDAVGEVQFAMDAYQTLPGDEIIIPVRVKDFNAIAGYQFTLTWNAEVIQLLEVVNQSIPAYYGEQSISDGILTTSWNDGAGEAVTLADDVVAFELKFKVIGANGTASEIKIGSELTASEAYTDALDLLDITATDGSVKVGEVISSLNTQHSTLNTLQVQPNPFSNSTNIIFTLPQEEHVRIVIYDLLGKAVRTFSGNYGAGEHQLQWNGQDENGNALSKGVYHIRMQTIKNSAAVKAVLIK